MNESPHGRWRSEVIVRRRFRSILGRIELESSWTLCPVVKPGKRKKEGSQRRTPLTRLPVGLIAKPLARKLEWSARRNVRKRY